MRVFVPFPNQLTVIRFHRVHIPYLLEFQFRSGELLNIMARRKASLSESDTILKKIQFKNDNHCVSAGIS